MPTGPPPAPFVPNVDNDGVSVKVRKKGVDLSNGGAVDVSAATATSDVLSAAAAADSASDVASIREAVSSMRVKEITTELASLGVDKGDAIQKEDLVEKLVQARMGGGVAAAPPVETAPAPTKSALGDAFAKAPKKEKKKKKGMFGGGGGGKGAGANPFAGGANPFTGPDPFGFGSPFGADPMAGFDGFADNLGVDPQEAMEQAAKMMDDPDGQRCCFVHADPAPLSTTFSCLDTPLLAHAARLSHRVSLPPCRYGADDGDAVEPAGDGGGDGHRDEWRGGRREVRDR